MSERERKDVICKQIASRKTKWSLMDVKQRKIKATIKNEGRTPREIKYSRK